MRHLLLSVAGLAIVLLPTVSNAQRSAECNAALVQSTYMLSDSRFNDARLASMLTNDEWNAATHDIHYQGFIFGQPQKASWQDSVRSARATAQASNQTMTSAEAHNVMWTGLTETSERAYSTCINRLSQAGGLSLAIESATAIDFVLRLSWSPRRDDPLQIPVTWTAAGEPKIIDDLPSNADSGSARYSVLRPSKAVSLTVNSRGVSDFVTLTPFVPPAPPPPSAPRRPAYPITVFGQSYSSISGAEYGGAITNGYGFAYLHNGPDYNSGKRNWVQFIVTANAEGRYRLHINFAAADARPISITINDQPAFPSALNFTTGCWLAKCRQNAQVGIVTLRQGTNTVEFEQPHAFPHIEKFYFEPVDP